MLSATNMSSCVDSGTIRHVSVDDHGFSRCVKPESDDRGLHWVDGRLLEFFRRYPKGMGVEVNAGLSTRFHRLSARLDWPQFSWRLVNSADMTACVSRVFPPLDNHVCVSSDSAWSGWCQGIDSSVATAKIIIFDRSHPVRSWQDFEQINRSIMSYLTQENPVIEVILPHTIDSITARTQRLSNTVYSVSSFSEFGDKPCLFSRIFSVIKNRFNLTKSVSIDHLVFRWGS